MPGFLKLLLSTKSVCLCVSALEALNYIHMTLNLYIKVSKFSYYVVKCNETILSMDVASVTKHIVKKQPNETKVMLYK